MKKLIDFSKLKIGNTIRVTNRSDIFGWHPEMKASLGKFLIIRNIILPSSNYKGSIKLCNGYIYPFECFDGKFKKTKVPKWKKYWKKENI